MSAKQLASLGPQTVLLGVVDSGLARAKRAALDPIMISPEMIFRREHPVAHPLGELDQLAVFDPVQSEIVVLNALGGAIWQMFDGELSLAQIAQEVAENVPNAPELTIVLGEVIRFAESLVARRALSLVDGADTGPR